METPSYEAVQVLRSKAHSLVAGVVVVGRGLVWRCALR